VFIIIIIIIIIILYMYILILTVGNKSKPSFRVDITCSAASDNEEIVQSLVYV